MEHPTDTIRCGSTILRYYSGYGGWQLPDKSITRNPFKAHKAAEEAEARRRKKIPPWELYEIEVIMNRGVGHSARNLAKKLNRPVSDVENLIQSLYPR